MRIDFGPGAAAVPSSHALELGASTLDTDRKPDSEE